MNLAPNFDLEIGNTRISDGIRQAITSVSYEHTDGMADLLKLTIDDPPNDQGVMPLRESRLFMPGNEISVWYGYGASLTHVGRGIVRKMRPTFPAASIPTIEVVAYTKDSILADNSPEPLKEKRHLKNGKTKVVNSKAGRRWHEAKFSDAVEDRAKDYGFKLDVDPSPDEPHDFIQKAGLSDSDFLRGLANITGYYLWVDGDEHGVWTLHFKNPDKLDQADIQDKKYTFKYNDGDFTTLLDFEPELAIQGAITKLRVQSKDPLTGHVMDVKFQDEEGKGPDPLVQPGGSELTTKGQGLNLELKSAQDVKIYVGDYSFEVLADRVFLTEKDLENWARAWFRRNRDTFILGSGHVVGVESLRALQTHTLSGLGTAYDGDYQFTRVRHVFNNGGYTCDFSARKVVDRLPPPVVSSVVPDIPVRF